MSGKQIVIGIAIFGAIVFIGSTWIIGSAIFDGIKAGKAWKEANAASSGIVVYADRDVAEGNAIEEDDIIEAKIDPDKIPVGTILCKDLIIGEKSRYGLTSGQIIAVHDFGKDSAVEKEQNKKLEARQSKDESLCHHKSFLDTTFENSTKGVVFYAIKDVKEGDVITKDDVERKEIDKSKIPLDSVHNIEVIINKKSKYGISEGQIVSIHDLAAVEGSGTKYFRASRDIEDGQVLTDADLTSETSNLKPCPDHAALSKNKIVGRKARGKIDKGLIIKTNFLEGDPDEEVDEDVDDEGADEEVDEEGSED